MQGSLGGLLLDIQAFVDNRLEDGFGWAAPSKQINSGNIVHQKIIKRFNQHLFMVLRTCTDDVKTLNRGIGLIMNATPATVTPTVQSRTSPCDHENNHIANGDTNGNHGPPAVEEQLFESAIMLVRVVEKIHYDDLEDDVDASSQNS